MPENDDDKLLEFPCDFPLKIVGLNNDAFEMEVYTIIRQHVPELTENAIKLRKSKDAKYLSITVSFTAESQEQLDALYQQLSANELTLMCL